ncbi:MAG: preprotein translocase subunit SecA [Bacteroidetes bacterium 4572_77]|nr:MAG: preprotein translocase subunit SecA [Bacteroidetes bacterium 4572_77]
MLGFFKKMLGSKSDRDIKDIMPIVNKAIAAYKDVASFSGDQLRAKTLEFKQKIADATKTDEDRVSEIKQKIAKEVDIDIHEKEQLYEEIDQLKDSIYQSTESVLNDILPEVFAVIKSTARLFFENKKIEVEASNHDRDLAARMNHVTIEGDKAIFDNEWEAGGTLINWDMIHYDVQLIGGIVLHQGKIAEMATGEGKTLVATLPVFLNALSGKGVHVVTVNDYLAKRDAEWMGMIYEFHGLSIDCIDKHQPNSDDRRKAYLADITYGTNNEFGFDYLRDNMTSNPDDIVQREPNYAIVDEVDSVLIDDARTPLIISGPTPKGDIQEFDNLKPNVDKLYQAQRKLVTGMLAESKKILNGNPNSEQEKKGSELLFRAFRGLPKNKALIKFLSEEGIRTKMQKTENFYMQEQNKNMHIIDDELYFVIEEKNNQIELTDKGIDVLTSSYDEKDFYILPDIAADLSQLEKLEGTAQEKAQHKADILRNFSIKSERVHTVNQLLKAYALFEKDVEYVIMDNKVKIVDEQTGRIMEGRRYSDGLHQAIEAKENVNVEAATQTYATITLQNYFRMYRKLAGMTGTAETEAGELWDIYKLDVIVIPTNRPIVRFDREDLVFKTTREKFNAVALEIESLVKHGRPVLVGTTSVETSELLSRMLTRQRIDHNVLNAKLHQREADIVAEAGRAGTVTIATNMAGRGTDIKLQGEVKEAGGLAILGTERHDSRRVDRQLRGRSGRQGDAGSSQFYVSLEDNLMRMFGSERISKIMDRLGLEEGEVIQHNMITKSIERAQKKVEENNFGVRKRLLEYDDVMNSQREVIYKKRHHALYGERLAVDINNMMFDFIEQLVSEYVDNRDFESFNMELIQSLTIESPISEEEFATIKYDDLVDKVYDKAYKNYKEKSARIAEKVYPVIKDVYENQAHYKNIAIPISDGVKTINVIADLEKAYNDGGKEVALSIEKGITLSIIDNSWKEHLREMDDLKQSVQNATYEQKDPLLIYKFESFNLFKDMVQRNNKDITSFLIKGDLPQQQTEFKEVQLPSSNKNLKEGRDDLLSQSHSNTQDKQKPQPIKVEKQVGRNEPCPCGSGKKYKHCHGK